MNGAIKLAIEKGGYNSTMQPLYGGTLFGRSTSAIILLDPAFWQALGKALGWDVICRTCRSHGDAAIMQRHACEHTKEVMEGWLYRWYRFIEWIAHGKSPDDFFKALLAERRAV